VVQLFLYSMAKSVSSDLCKRLNIPVAVVKETELSGALPATQDSVCISCLKTQTKTNYRQVTTYNLYTTLPIQVYTVT
jgi:hypothetical protein